MVEKFGFEMNISEKHRAVGRNVITAAFNVITAENIEKSAVSYCLAADFLVIICHVLLILSFVFSQGQL